MGRGGRRRNTIDNHNKSKTQTLEKTKIKGTDLVQRIPEISVSSCSNNGGVEMKTIPAWKMVKRTSFWVFSRRQWIDGLWGFWWGIGLEEKWVYFWEDTSKAWETPIWIHSFFFLAPLLSGTLLSISNVVKLFRLRFWSELSVCKFSLPITFGLA